MSDRVIETLSMRQLPLELEPEQLARTIGTHQGIVRGTWGRHNRIGSSPREMIEMMWIWYGTLSECTRNAPRKACSTEFAMLNFVTTLFCLANQMDVELDVAMASKYPNMCFYCHKVEGCICGGEATPRGPKVFAPARPELLGLPIGGWQDSLGLTYGEGNARRGLDFVMRRLAEELAELLKAVREKHISPINEEIADVTAWSFGLATIQQISMARLLINPLRRLHLPDACFACTLTPCVHGPNCPIF